MQPFGGFTPCENAQGVAQPCVSAAATEQTPYLHSDFSPAGSSDICSEDRYAPLVTAGNVAEGTEFGEEGRCPVVTALCGPQFVGASPDARHIVLTSEAPLIAECAGRGVCMSGPRASSNWSVSVRAGSPYRLRLRLRLCSARNL